MCDDKMESDTPEEWAEIQANNYKKLVGEFLTQPLLCERHLFQI